MNRHEFSARVKVQAFERAKGFCEAPGCTTKLRPGDLYYDHVIPDALGGEPILANCQCLCKSHHDPKTREEDVPRIAKAKREFRGHIGAKPKHRWPKRPFATRNWT